MRDRVQTIAVAWLAIVALDFAVHAGALAPLYDWSSPFLLTPADAFLRIPVAYLALLGLAGGLVWLLPRLGVHSGPQGAGAAAGIGGVGLAVFLAGLWSVSTADPALLIGWWTGQTAELGLAGWIIGAVLGGRSLKRVSLWALVVVVAAIVVAILLQAVGYATAPVIRA